MKQVCQRGNGVLKMCDVDVWKGVFFYFLNLILFNFLVQFIDQKIFFFQDIIEYKYGEYFYSKIFFVVLDYIYFNLLQWVFNYFVYCVKVSFLGNFVLF